MSFLHGSDWSRLMSFLHGSYWSRSTSCATAKTRFWSRTASFLSVSALRSTYEQHSTVVGSKFRLSWNSPSTHLLCHVIDANFRQLLSESKKSYLGNVPCLGEYGNCLITNLSPRSQTKISHIDNSHLVCICFCRAATQKSSPTSLILVPTRFALIPGSTNR